MTATIRRFFPLIVVSLFVAGLWLPFGLKTTGLMEEWLSYNTYERSTPTERDEPVNFLTLSGQQRLRPLQDTTMAFAHLITPDSFVALNLVAIVSLILKGLALYLILSRLLPDSKAFALLAALLLIVFPADEGIFTFRAVHIHGAVALYLFGVYFLLRLWDRFEWWSLLLMWATVIASLFVYEVGYALVFVTPLILIVKRNTPDFGKRLIRLGIAWYLAPLITLVYAALTLGDGDTYQGWVIQHSGINEPSIITDLARSVGNAYYQHFVGGWLDALRTLTANAGFDLLAGVLTVGALAAAMRLKQTLLSTNRRSFWLFASGFVMIFLGFAPFLITPSRDVQWRVFLFSSVGGALCFVSLCLWLSHRSRPVYYVLVGAFLFVATVNGLNQQQYYVSLSQTEQQLLRGVIEQIPQPKPNVPVVVVDETGKYWSNWTLGASYLLTASLQYIYEDYSAQFVLCSYGADGQFVALPELLERCGFDANGVTLYQNDQLTASYPYSQIVVLRHTSSDTTILTTIPPEYLPAGQTALDYAPAGLLDYNAAPPRRFHTLFSIAD